MFHNGHYREVGLDNIINHDYIISYFGRGKHEREDFLYSLIIRVLHTCTKKYNYQIPGFL